VPFHVPRIKRAVERDEAAHQLQGRTFSGHRLVGLHQELVTATATAARDDDVRSRRIAVVHRVALVVRVVQRVDDEPGLVKTASGHVDVQEVADAAAATVAPEHVVDQDRPRRCADGVAQLHRDRVGTSFDGRQRGAELLLHVRVAVQSFAQDALEVWLREGALDGVPEPTVALPPVYVRQKLSAPAVVPGAGARHDDVVNGFGETADLE